MNWRERMGMITKEQQEIEEQKPHKDFRVVPTMSGNSGFNIATYNLQLFSPEVDPSEETSAYRWSDSDKRVMADLPAMLEQVEEALEGLLPEGYTVRITEWNK